MMTFTVLLLVTLAVAFHNTHALSVATPAAKKCSGTRLGKKSTAINVLTQLNRADRLAPHVREGGTAVVTGGNSGIGAVTAKTLALTGMKVILCARNPTSAQKVVDEIAPGCRDNVEIQQLDLSDMASIDAAAEAIKARGVPIDVLVNNAGILSPLKRTVTAQDIELTFGVNHVGHHMLTRLLLPTLRPDGGRIVTVASEAHRSGTNTEFWKRDNYVSIREYGDSKLANILFAKRLQELCVQEGMSSVTSVCLHPGVIGTGLWRDTPILNTIQPLLDGVFFDKTIEQGAATNVYCAMADEVEGGAYYSDCKVASETAVASNVELRMKLWDYTEQLIAEKGFVLPDKLFEVLPEVDVTEISEAVDMILESEIEAVTSGETAALDSVVAVVEEEEEEEKKEKKEEQAVEEEQEEQEEEDDQGED